MSKEITPGEVYSKVNKRIIRKKRIKFVLSHIPLAIMCLSGSGILWYYNPQAAYFLTGMFLFAGSIWLALRAQINYGW